MSALIALAVVVGGFTAWGLSPDRDSDGKPVTGVYAFPPDSLHAPHARHTALDTQRVTAVRP